MEHELRDYLSRAREFARVLWETGRRHDALAVEFMIDLLERGIAIGNYDAARIVAKELPRSVTGHRAYPGPPPVPVRADSDE